MELVLCSVVLQRSGLLVFAPSIALSFWDDISVLVPLQHELLIFFSALKSEINFPKELSNLRRPVERALENRSAKDSQPNGCESRTFGDNMVGGLFVLSAASTHGVIVLLDDQLVSL